DDNDNNLANGTPNLNAIVNAFAFHGIRMLANVQFSYPHLADIPAQTPATFNVTLSITPPFNTLISGAKLIYRLNNLPLSTCDTIALTAGAGNSYSGVIPAQPRGTIVRYFVGLQDLTGASGGAYPPFADLSSSPGLWFNYLVGFQNTYNLDIENPAQDSTWLIGWSTDNAVTGIWEIGTPIPSYVTPGSIATIVQTGSNATPGGSRCAYTGNALTSSDDPDTEDVDGGRTTLRTPPMDMTGMADPVLAYQRWYTNDMGDNRIGHAGHVHRRCAQRGTSAIHIFRVRVIAGGKGIPGVGTAATAGGCVAARLNNACDGTRGNIRWNRCADFPNPRNRIVGGPSNKPSGILGGIFDIQIVSVLESHQVIEPKAWAGAKIGK
ncbi:MAG: hypothetical protein ACKO55_08545, partial [Bacteroidota bacterium]